MELNQRQRRSATARDDGLRLGPTGPDAISYPLITIELTVVEGEPVSQSRGRIKDRGAIFEVSLLDLCSCTNRSICRSSSGKPPDSVSYSRSGPGALRKSGSVAILMLNG